MQPYFAYGSNMDARAAAEAGLPESYLTELSKA
jgi:hypothetical protein